MTPRRLLEETRDPTEQLLLRAVKDENLSREGRERIVASFGLAGAGVSAGAGGFTKTASAKGSAVAAPHASFLHAVTVKWVGLCALGLVPAAVILTRQGAPRIDAAAVQASPIAPPVRAAPVVGAAPELGNAQEENGALASNPGAGESLPRTSTASPVSTGLASRPVRRPRSNASETTASLAQEVNALRAVRSALDGGDAAGALSDLDRFDRRFPTGRLGPEAMALRIEALAMRGDRKAAHALADHFDAAYSGSPYRARLHSILIGPAASDTRSSAAAGR